MFNIFKCYEMFAIHFWNLKTSDFDDFYRMKK